MRTVFFVTRIEVDRDQNLIGEFLANRFLQLFTQVVALPNVVEPGQRQIAVNIKSASVADDFQIVDIDPCRIRIFGYNLKHLFEAFFVGFVGQFGNRFPKNRRACPDNRSPEDQCQSAIDPFDAGHVEQDQTDDQSYRRDRVRLQVFPSGNQGKRVVFAPHMDAVSSQQKVDGSCCRN